MPACKLEKGTHPVLWISAHPGARVKGRTAALTDLLGQCPCAVSSLHNCGGATGRAWHDARHPTSALHCPQGLKANMTRLYQLMTESQFARCSKPAKYKKLLFALCFFHSVLLERKKFLQLGWNIVYGFNDSDFEVCASRGPGIPAPPPYTSRLAAPPPPPRPAPCRRGKFLP